jgi:PKD repeat protein
LSVAFTDTSTPAATAWLWDFGETPSVTSSLQNPTHVYSAPGTYLVLLTSTIGGVTVTSGITYVTVNYDPVEYILTSADAGVDTRVTNPAPYTNIHIPTNIAHPDNLVGMEYSITKISAGTVNIVADPGVTLNTSASLTLTNLADSARLIKVGTNEWDMEFIGVTSSANSVQYQQGGTNVPLAPSALQYLNFTLGNKGGFFTSNYGSPNTISISPNIANNHTVSLTDYIDIFQTVTGSVLTINNNIATGVGIELPNISGFPGNLNTSVTTVFCNDPYDFGNAFIINNSATTLYNGAIVVTSTPILLTHNHTYEVYVQQVQAPAKLVIADPGLLYTDGTYFAVPLTGGTGSGATANIVVSSGSVASAQIVQAGSGYTFDDTLSASSGDIGGTGSGLLIYYEFQPGTPTTESIQWVVIDSSPVPALNATEIAYGSAGNLLTSSSRLSWSNNDISLGLGNSSLNSTISFGQNGLLTTDGAFTFATTGHTMVYDSTGTITLDTLPGTAGQVLTSGGAGAPAVWAAGGGTPALPSTQIAFGDGSNLLTSSSDLEYNVATSTLTVGSVAQNGTIQSGAGQALIVKGDVGVILTGAANTMEYTADGALNIDGDLGLTGKVLTSDGPGFPVFWSDIATPGTPASAIDTGRPGQVFYDTSYIYICVATDTWMRAPIATW